MFSIETRRNNGASVCGYGITINIMIFIVNQQLTGIGLYNNSYRKYLYWEKNL